MTSRSHELAVDATPPETGSHFRHARHSDTPRTGVLLQRVPQVLRHGVAVLSAGTFSERLAAGCISVWPACLEALDVLDQALTELLLAQICLQHADHAAALAMHAHTRPSARSVADVLSHCLPVANDVEDFVNLIRVLHFHLNRV